jgi:hypothetical protein
MKFLKGNRTRPFFPGRSKLSLDLSKFNQIKVILGKLSLFQEIKDCLFFWRRKLSDSARPRSQHLNCPSPIPRYIACPNDQR